MYIYLQVNRVNIIQVRLAGQSQAEANEVQENPTLHDIQFSQSKMFLRQKTFQEVIFKVTPRRSE